MTQKTEAPGPMCQAAQTLLPQTRRLKHQIAAFSRTARKLVEELDETLSSGEVVVMETPRANLLGALECLLADDFAPALRKLDELDNLLPIFLQSFGDSALDDD